MPYSSALIFAFDFLLQFTFQYILLFCHSGEMNRNLPGNLYFAHFYEHLHSTCVFVAFNRCHFRGAFLVYTLADSVNRASLETIEKGMFMLCLDISPVPVIESMDESDDHLNPNDFSLTLTNDDDLDVEEEEALNEHRDDEFLVQQMLHGQGSRWNGANRWYDKTMQVLSNILRIPNYIFLERRNFFNEMNFVNIDVFLEAELYQKSENDRHYHKAHNFYISI